MQLEPSFIMELESSFIMEHEPPFINICVVYKRFNLLLISLQLYDSIDQSDAITIYNITYRNHFIFDELQFSSKNSYNHFSIRTEIIENSYIFKI